VLTEADWATAYDYLLKRLRELELNELALEIDAAVAERVVERFRPVEPNLFSRADLSEQGDTVSRARRPSEAWQAAMMVLHTYLVEVPSVAARVGNLLGLDLDRIVFYPDAREEDLQGSLRPFELSHLTLSGRGSDRVESNLNTLLNFSGLPSNARSNAG